MSDITLSSGVRSNLLSLQNTADLLATTQERLATGLKVNSALDNPTNFFTASSLNSRASDLSALLDSISNANQTLEAADNGLSAITDLVESAQAAARQALQTSATVEETTDATSAEISSSGFSAVDLSEAGSAATAGAVSFSFGGSTGAFDGVDDEISFDISVDGVNQSVSIDQAAVQGVGNNDSTIDDADELAAILNAQISGATVTNDAGTISITSDTTGSSSSVVITNYAVTDTNSSGFADNTGISNDSGTGTDAVAADTISFDLTVGGTTQTITLDSSITAVDSSAVTAEEIATAINTQFGSSVADGSTGELVITDSTTGSSSAVTIANFATTGNATTSGLSDGTDAGTDESTTEVANPKRDEYVATYNDLLTQIDDLAEDAGFNGVNLLAGDDLSVLFNEDGSSKLDISGGHLRLRRASAFRPSPTVASMTTTTSTPSSTR